MSVDIFDRVYDAYTGEMGQQFMRETQRRMHWICSAVQGGAVLDVGCSQGILPILLGREGRTVTGIDSDPRSIKDADRHLADEAPGVRKRVTFIEAEFLSYHFGEERFDTIVMGEVLEHLVAPDRFVARARELLKPGGKLIVTVPFGINDHPDHKRTYYLSEPYRLLANDFDVSSYEILGKWLGLIGSPRAAGSLPHEGWNDEQLRGIEQAFHGVERALVDDNTFLRGKLDDANVKYRAATEEVTRLQREAAQSDHDRKAAEKVRSQLEVRVAGHDKDQQELRKGHDGALAQLREELLAARETRHGLELTLARLEERHVALEQRQKLELSLAEAKLEELRGGLSTLEGRQAELTAELAERTKALDEQAAAAQRAVSEREDEIARLRTCVTEQAALLESSEQQKLKLEIQLGSHQSDLGEARAELQQQRAARMALQAASEVKEREVGSLRRQLSDAQRAEQSAKEAVQTARLGEQTAKQAELTAKRSEQAAKENEQRAKLAEQAAKQAERKAINQLDMSGRARSAAERKVRQVQNTLSFQLGYELIHGFKSPKRAISLPKTLWALQQEAVRRRHDRALREGNSQSHVPPPPAAPLPSSAVAAGVVARSVPVGPVSTVPVPVVPMPVVVPTPVPATQQRAVDAREGSVEARPAHLPSASIAPASPASPALALPKTLLTGLRSLKVACIHDEFTFASFSPECALTQLTPSGFREELESCQPDLLFVESAWRGKDDLWGAKVGHRSRELVDIVSWCKQHGVPTVFWNKEDPVHFQGFLSTAQLFDFVFTTDFDCVHRYKRILGHERVYALPFACQPTQHNPIEKYARKPAACFAGAYYARYPERQQDLASLARALGDVVGLEIYDRNHGKEDPSYAFPDEYRKYIVGTLPFDEIDRAYKGYRYALNLNSIKQSQTMFARRLFELLASNTLTISNFSRGIRTMFGDLVVATDSGEAALRRLSQFEADPSLARRVRLAALRKVLLEHTYSERLRYIAEKVWSRPLPDALPAVTVVARATTADELSRVLAAYARQNYAKKSLLLVTPQKLDCRRARKDHSVQLVALETLRADTLAQLAPQAELVAGMIASDHYGASYLVDLALATRYSDAAAFGKVAHYRANAGSVELVNDGQQYRNAGPVAARAALVRLARVGQETVLDWLDSLPSRTFDDPSSLALDEFNYCLNGGELSTRTLASVDDLGGLDHGLSLPEMLATRVSAGTAELDAALAQRPQITATRLFDVLRPKRDSAVTLSLQDDALRISATLPDETHEYVYASQLWPIAALGQAVNKLHFDAGPGLNVQLALLFVDDSKQRLGNRLLVAGRNELVTVPAGTTQVQLALRVHGAGSCKISGLVLDHLPEAPAHIFARSEYLLITNHYPSYWDLYRNGFVHQRVLGYQRQGTKVDVFRMRPGETLRYAEFEGVDVASGGAEALRIQLISNDYKVILIHFLDEQMWNVLRGACPEKAMLVWVHGAEIQSWIRRDYNYSTPDSLATAKTDSEARSAFWRRITKQLPERSKLIFVSRGFADESMQDNDFRVPESQLEIVHNVIDTTLFKYRPKSPEHRTRILSLRPFASRKYANDLTVKAILELSKEAFFSELEFYFVGDGPLFDETVAPLRGLTNVKLERRFFRQREISELHENYGIFLCPTRADSQGVSRDEAMSSGLVPITSRVGAVSEFVDAECGILTEGENYQQLAEGVARLYHDPELFLRLSKAASERVRRQSSPAQTTQRELDLLRYTSALSALNRGGR